MTVCLTDGKITYGGYSSRRIYCRLQPTSIEHFVAVIRGRVVVRTAHARTPHKTHSSYKKDSECREERNVATFERGSAKALINHVDATTVKVALTRLTVDEKIGSKWNCYFKRITTELATLHFSG